MENLSPIVKYVFITPLWPANKLQWYNVIFLSVHTSGITNNNTSFSGVVIIWNNNESSNIYLC